MEFHLSYPTTILALALSVYFLFLITRYGQKKAKKNKPSAPEAAGAWPLIGHLHLLGGSGLPHKTFAAMADKFGPIFTLKLGSHPAIVVSNWEIAKECFTTNDAVFVNRPRSISAELMGYNYAMFAFSPYGPYWREMRKIATLELLSNRRLELLKHIWQSEVKTSVREIYDLWSRNKGDCGSDKVLVEMKKWFGGLSYNVMVRMIARKRFSGEKDEEDVVQFQDAIRELLKLSAVVTLSDVLPFVRFLRWLDLGGYEKAMKRTSKDLDAILQKWLDEHKKRRISVEVMKKKKEQDFMDVMLSILEGDGAIDDQSSYDSDTINKATCLVVLAGGTDTTTVTLTWALSLLLNHPHALRKAQEELDLYVGKKRQVEESDMKNLVYLQAIIKEAFRFYPAVPLLALRESVEDCTVGGYHVPKGTRLIVNAWKIQRDPRVWLYPNEFRPERFLTTHKDVDFKGQHFELIPFGSGRRYCPGISLSLQIIQLALATLLHGFTLETVSNKPVDMSESFGLTNLKATPLEVLVTPRLDFSLYE